MTIFNEIDLDAVHFNQITTNNNGGRVVYVNKVANDSGFREQLRVQLSKRDMSDLNVCPYGVSVPQTEEQMKNSRRTLDLSLNDEQRAFVERLDNKIIDVATERSNEWFKKPMDRATVSAMYTPLLHSPSSEGRPYTVRTKVKMAPTAEELERAEREGRKKKPVPTNVCVARGAATADELGFHKVSLYDVCKGSKCMVIVDLTSVWFINQRQFGVTLVVNDLMVWPNREGGVNGFDVGPVKLVEQEQEPEEMD